MPQHLKCLLKFNVLASTTYQRDIILYTGTCTDRIKGTEFSVTDEMWTNDAQTTENFLKNVGLPNLSSFQR